MQARIPRTVSRPKKEPRPGMSESHLVMVRKLPCVLCGLYGHDIQAHHLLRTGEHGVGRKSSDRWAISLCRFHHDGLHGHGDEEAYLSLHGIDGRALASALWAARGDQEAMERVVFRFRQEAALKKKGAA